MPIEQFSPCVAVRHRQGLDTWSSVTPCGRFDPDFDRSYNSQDYRYLWVTHTASDGRKRGIIDRFVVLSVGDTHKLGLGKDRIMYAGMPSEKVFSIVQMKWEFFYRGYAWNLFSPTNRSEIRIEGVNILVEHVTPDEIRLRL